MLEDAELAELLAQHLQLKPLELKRFKNAVEASKLDYLEAHPNISETNEHQRTPTQDTWEF